MSKTFELIRHLIQQGQILVSEHGYDELAADDIFIKDVLAGINEGIIVEDYPDYSEGPCVLVLQKDVDGDPIHAVGASQKAHQRKFRDVYHIISRQEAFRMIGMRHAASVKNRCSGCVAPFSCQRNKTYNQIYVPDLLPTF